MNNHSLAQAVMHETNNPVSSPDSIPPLYSKLVSKLKHIDGTSSFPAIVNSSKHNANQSRSCSEDNQTAMTVDQSVSKNTFKPHGRISSTYKGPPKGPISTLLHD